MVDWCDLAHIPIVHIPNEGKRGLAYANTLKRMGLRPGFPDLFVPLARGGYHGLFVEMKSDKGKPSEKQKEWLRALNKEGYACTVCRSADDAIKMIYTYVNRIGG